MVHFAVIRFDGASGACQDHLRLRCPSRPQKSQRFLRQEKGGRSPATSAWFPPGQRSGELECLDRVSVTLRVFVLAGCLFCSHLVSAWLFAVLLGNLRTAKCWDTTFGVFVLCWVCCPLFAPPGAVPVVGGYLYPSVLRSPGVTPQECRAAHGRLHPAVTSPPRLCWFCIWFMLGFSGMDVGYSIWCFLLPLE